LLILHLKPYYNDLLELLDNVNEAKKTEFTVALSHTFNNFLVSSWDAKNKTFKVINSSTQNDVKNQILTNWSKNFKKLFVEEETFTRKVLSPITLQLEEETATRTAYSSSKIEDLETKLNSLKEEFDKANKHYNIDTIKTDEFTEKFERSAMLLEDILNSLGVEIQPNAFIYYMSHINGDSLNASKKDYVNTLSSVIFKFKNLTRDLKTSRVNVKNYNPILDNKSILFNKLAQAEAFYNEDLTDTNVLANNKMYWAFSNPSHISKTINNYKNNPDTLRDVQKQTINNHSVWATKLLGEEKTSSNTYKYDEAVRKTESAKNLKGLKLQLFTSYQEDNKSSEGVSNSEISETDQIVDEINKVERANIRNKQGNRINNNSIYSTSTPADKTTRFEISINSYLEDVVSRSNNNGSIEAEFSDEILDTFKDYFLDEVNRMKEAAKELETLSPEELKVHYHTVKGEVRNEKTNVVLGNAFKSQIFPELSFESISPELNEKLGLYTKEGIPRLLDETKFTVIQETIIKDEISKIFNNLIKENIKSLEKKGLVRSKLDRNGQRVYDVYGIDKST